MDLHRYCLDGVVYRSYVGAVRVPEELGSIVQAVFGLDNRPVARASVIPASTSRSRTA